VKWIVAAVIVGGAAAFVASPTLRTRAAGEPTTSPPTAVANPPPTPASGSNLEKVSETVPSKEAPAEVSSAAAAPSEVAPSATAESAAVPPAAAPSATAATPAPSAGTPSSALAPSSGSGSEVDPSALAALGPGQGYLYIASPLSTNVYVYGILAGTTNQRITSKCGPRFIRLGSAPGIWQGEGQVQIVKCGALTRMEMGQ
jgi:hypothetical protein